MSKKPYRINLDASSSILGMPANAKNWVLLANYADKTLIRNALAFEISKYLGLPYTSPYRFVDVILNGDNLGTYLLTDHMEVREHRVDIEEGIKKSVPGAYLMELDGFADNEDFYITTSHHMSASFKFPEDMTAEHETFILDHINTFENRLFSEAPADGPGGYLEYADLASLVNWYLACEITGNSDSFWSTYLHKRRSDNHFFMGPLWDFDIAFDNDDRIGNARFRLMADVAHGFKERKWIVQLRKDDVFMRAVKARWNELKEEGFKDFILGKITELSGILSASGSVASNFSRWPVLGTKVYREIFPSGSYPEHVDFLYNYLSTRIDWLDVEMNGFPSNYHYKFENSVGGKALSVEVSGERQLVVQKTYSDISWSKWQVIPLPNGFYQLKNVGTDNLLTGSDPGSGQLVLLPPDPGNILQHWRITQAGTNAFALVGRKSVFGLQSRNNLVSEGNPVDEVVFTGYTNDEVQYWLADTAVGRWIITPVSEALPVRIRPLTARYAEGTVSLEWGVIDYSDVHHFEIERFSKDGEGRILGSVELTKDGTGEYNWKDEHPLPGVNYYRLRMVASEGSYEYSNLVWVRSENDPLSVSVFPNPSVHESYAEVFTADGGAVIIEILSMTGQCLSTSVHIAAAGMNRWPLETGNLSRGLYILKASCQGRTVAKRLVAGN